MNTPDMTEVETADHEQLSRWWRFLKCPEYNEALSIEENRANSDKHISTMERIKERLYGEFGGFTPAISKAIGW